METAFGVETLEDAMAHHGKSEIFNTEQDSQFTGLAFTSVLINNGIAINMDGKGAWGTMCSSSGCGAASNTRKSISSPTTVSEARASIDRYLDFYNRRRPDSSLDGKTPDQAYFNPLPLRLAA